MAMLVESLSDGSNSPNSSLKVKGDLGDLQICEADSSESDDEKTCDDKQKVSRTISTLPNNLVKKSNVPVFGSVAVSNSENVQFGNNTYFNGPVTIKQVIQSKSGVENASYTRSEDELGGASDVLPDKQTNAPVGKQPVLRWQKVALSLLCATVIGSIIGVIVVLPKYGAPGTTSSLPDFGSTEIPAYSSLVVGDCCENCQVILITIILLLLLIFVLIYPLLLTREVPGKTRTCVKKSTVHDNCMIKSCPICNVEDPLIAAPEHLRIVSRVDWLAQPVEGELDKMILPVPWVIITHTATEMCYSQSQCVLQARLIQMFHIESRGWFDIGYNFLVGGDGSVYYGRGWDYIGAHTKYYNKYSIGIAFIGTFNTDPPTNQQVEACEKLIRLGVSLGKLAKDYKLLAHRQLMSTLSPGDKVFDIIKEWPHFVTNVTDANELLPEDRRSKSASAL